MFKIGDKVVCVDIEGGSPVGLKLNNIYTIKDMEDWFVKLYEIDNFIYDYMRFVSLKELRREKLIKINHE